MNMAISFESVPSEMKEAHLSLAEQVEQFLKNGGNITHLKMGETQYPDGKLPPPPKPTKAEREKIEKSKVKNAPEPYCKSYEERRSAEVAKRKAQREAKKQAEKVARAKARAEREAERERIREAKKQAHKAEVEKRAIARKKAVEERRKAKQEAKLKAKQEAAKNRDSAKSSRVKVRASISAERQQYLDWVAEMKILRENAIKINSETFTGRCLNGHGLTEFRIINNKNSQYCVACQKQRRSNAIKLLHVFPRRNERLEVNRALMFSTIEKNQKYYLGFCLEHGKTHYVIHKGASKAGYSFYCMICRNVTFKENVLVSDIKPVPKVKKVKPKRIPKLKVYSLLAMCKKENAERKAKAIEQGLTRFEGVCVHHGYAPYRITEKDGGINCRKCEFYRRNRKYEISFEECEKRIANQLENQKRLEETLLKNADAIEFTGVCSGHGENRFYIRPPHNTNEKYTYRCSACSTMRNREYRSLKKSSGDLA